MSAYLAPRFRITADLTTLTFQPCECGIVLNESALRLRILRAGDPMALALVYDDATVGADSTITFPLDGLILQLADGIYDGIIEQSGAIVGTVELVKQPRMSGAAAISPNCVRP